MYFWGGWELRGVENRRQQFINLSLNLFSFSISFTVSFFGHYVSYYRKYILFSFCQFCLYLHLDFCVLRIVSLVYFNHLMDFVTSDKRFGLHLFGIFRLLVVMLLFAPKKQCICWDCIICCHYLFTEGSNNIIFYVFI